MNVAELKKRLLRGFAHSDLFYLPVDKQAKNGSFNVGTRIPYYNVDTETFDTSWQYWAWWNTSVVVKNSSGEIVYLLRKGYRAQLHKISNVPYGVYKAKVIYADYGGVRLDNEWHEFVLNDDTNNSTMYINLFYDVYKCVARPDRKEFSPTVLDITPRTKTPWSTSESVNYINSAVTTEFSYYFYENGNLVQDFGYCPPFGSPILEPISAFGSLAGNAVLMFDEFIGSVSAANVKYKRCSGLGSEWSDVSVKTQLLDTVPRKRLTPDYISLKDPNIGHNGSSVVGSVRTSISDNDWSYTDLMLEGSDIVPLFYTEASVENFSASGYNDYGFRFPNNISNFFSRSKYTGVYGVRCTRYTHTNEDFFYAGDNDLIPSEWLREFMKYEDELKKPREEWNYDNVAFYTGTVFIDAIWYNASDDENNPDWYVKTLTNQYFTPDKYPTNFKVKTKTIYNKHIPDFTNTEYYRKMQAAVKRGTNKNNYFGYSYFYWIHNGQAWWAKDQQVVIIRGTDDILQPTSTVEEYQMVGPAVWSDDYDDYY